MGTHKNLFLAGVIGLMFCFITETSCEACVTVNVANDTYTVDNSGCAKL